MTSQPHTQIRQHATVAPNGTQDQSPEPNAPAERPQRRPASRGRRAATAALVAVALASASAAIVTVAGHTPQSSAHALSAGSSAPLRVAATPNSFGRRLRALEAGGYVEVACMLHGDLMLNPHTHRYAKVQA